MNTLLTITLLTTLLSAQEGQEPSTAPDPMEGSYLLELTGVRSRTQKDHLRPDGRILMSPAGTIESRTKSVIKGALSPDGKRRLVQDRRMLRFATPDGRIQGMVTKTSSEKFDASWSPTGREFVYVADTGKARRINLTRVHDSSDMYLSTAEGDAGMPRWNPDGTTIAFRFWPKTDRNRRRKGRTNEHVLIVDRAGNTVHRLGAGATVTGLAWSPDGKRIAISELTKLRIYDSKTGELQRELANRDIHPKLFAHGAHNMHWRPDGQAIACHMDFLGGRVSTGQTVDGEPKFDKIFGDDQVFIILLTGQTRVLDVPQNPTGAPYRLSGWTGAQLLDR